MLLGLLQFINTIFSLIIYLVVASAILSWLLHFNIINHSNQFVAMISKALHQLTEPLLRPIRRFLPNMSGLDISPIILILIIFFIRSVILIPLARGL